MNNSIPYHNSNATALLISNFLIFVPNHPLNLIPVPHSRPIRKLALPLFDRLKAITTHLLPPTSPITKLVIKFADRGQGAHVFANTGADLFEGVGEMSRGEGAFLRVCVYI